MNKIRVIDLLNKKANGEELPSQINCYNQAFYLSDGIYIAKNQVGKFFEDYFDLSSLDYEVEVIEDTLKEDNKIEKLYIAEICDDELQGLIKSINVCNKEIQNKLNEIIEVINGRNF